MQSKFVLRQVLRVLPILAALLVPAWSSAQSSFPREFGRLEVVIDSVSHELETMTVRPVAPGKHPLAVVTHGGGRNHRLASPTQLATLARELAARGWLAVVVMRRGYGSSTGSSAEELQACDSESYVTAGTETAKDLRAVIDVLRRRGDVDANTVIAVGHSAGGFGTLALSAHPPEGLRAIVNFAGFRGSLASGGACPPAGLVAASGTFGASSRLPGLWFYVQNDPLVGADLPRRLHTAFTATGGNADFVMGAPHPTDAHGMVTTRSGPDQWTPALDEFLRRNNLPTPLSASAGTRARANSPAPAGLSERGQQEWTRYLDAADHSAFAVAPSGGFGWAANRRSDELARTAALQSCNKPDCAVVERPPTR